MFYAIEGIKRQRIVWRGLITRQKKEVRYSRDEWVTFREEVKRAYPYPLKKLGDLVGLTFDVSDDFTHLLTSTAFLAQGGIGQINVDVREPKEFDRIEHHFRTNLGTGDFAFFTHDWRFVLIERKTYSDLLNGMGEFGKTKTKSPRNINDQLGRLVNGCDIPILLLERDGNATLDDKSRVIRARKYAETIPWHGKPLSYLRHFIFDWQMAGVIVYPTLNISDSIKAIEELYRKLQRPSTAIYQRPRQIEIAHYPTKGINLLLGIEEYGLKTASSAMEHAKTARKFFNMSVDERTEIPGVGERRATLVDVALDEVFVSQEEIKKREAKIDFEKKREYHFGKE